MDTLSRDSNTSPLATALLFGGVIAMIVFIVVLVFKDGAKAIAADRQLNLIANTPRTLIYEGCHYIEVGERGRPGYTLPHQANCPNHP